MKFSLIAAVALATTALTAPAIVGAATQDAPAAAATTAETPSRVLPLEGGQNFRDLGGYRTVDGRTTRWRTLFRSGSMHDLTPADFAYLQKLGIRTVCDFRSSEERKVAPVAWPEGHAPNVLADDYTLASGGLDMRPGPDWTAEKAKATMAATYPHILEQFNSQYRRMFGELLAGNAPLAFNCTAGKDRTGVAAALVLTALGVPRETVIEDYLLTNRYFDPRKAMSPNSGATGDWAHLPPEVIKAFMGADRSYIEAVFKVIDANPGGADGYLRDKLGLGQAEIAALRAKYTVPA